MVAFDNIVAIFLAITITDNQPISNLVTKATNINKKVIVFSSAAVQIYHENHKYCQISRPSDLPMGDNIHVTVAPAELSEVLNLKLSLPASIGSKTSLSRFPKTRSIPQRLSRPPPSRQASLSALLMPNPGGLE